MAAEKIVLGEGCRMGGDCGFVGEVLVLLGCEKKKGKYTVGVRRHVCDNQVFYYSGVKKKRKKDPVFLPSSRVIWWLDEKMITKRCKTWSDGRGMEVQQTWGRSKINVLTLYW
jgi:hypothetical protein